MKKIILFLIVVSAINIIAQEEKIELLVGVKSLFPISDWDSGYFVGMSTSLGFVISPQTILNGSIAYLTFISNEESHENWESLPGIAMGIKRVFTLKESTIIPYLKLEAGLFIPMADDQFYSVFPELCGSAGMEFLINKYASIFIDVGYMLGIGAENIPKLISGNLGVNFRI
jgi:hypothetical protein